MNASQTQISNLINNTNISDVKRELFCRSCCKISGDIFEVLAHILLIVGTIFTFAGATWPLYTFLTYIGSVLNVIGIGCLRFSAYSMKDSQDRTNEINKILDSLHLQEIVDISTTSISSVSNSEITDNIKPPNSAHKINEKNHIITI